MNSPASSSPYLLSPKVSRKTVPEGSDDFQRVLDAILTDEGKNQAKAEGGRREVDKTSRYSYEDDFENLDDYNDNFEVGRILTPDLEEPDIDNDNNNTIHGNKSKCVCHIRQCKRLERNVYSPSSPLDSVSLSEVRIFDRNGLHLGEEHFYPNGSNAINSVKLPRINQGGSIMGTICSSNIYDKREWHSVAVGERSEERGRKKGKIPGKRPQSLFDDETLASNTRDGGTTQTCTCAQNNSESNHKTENSDDSERSSPQALLPSDSKKDRSPSPQSEQRKDKICSGKKSGSVASSGHSKLSRISNSKKLSSSSKLDVSPHRLLVRRSYSPQSRINSTDSMKRNRMKTDVYRQRSQSWSDPKVADRSLYKAPSPPSLRVHSPDTSPEANHTALSSPLSLSPSASKKSLSAHPQDQTDSPKSHRQDCPLFTEVEKDRLSVYANYLEDDDITPISRRRAVSESLACRPRHKTLKRPGSGECGQFDERHHVHWADERGGSALSTSVFLSSIRPRSYSHGAMGSSPQRPILKKVTGF